MGVGPILKMRYSTILLALLCVACGNYSANVPTLKPYKMDIQQGNVVTPKMMMQLRPGMTKSQVRFIMGTPLLVDSFHANRWDYFYQMRKDGKIIEQRRVILDFEGDSLAHVRGDVIPAGSDPAAVNADQPKNTQPRPVVKPAAKEKGLLDKLKFWGDEEDGKKDVPKEQTKPAEPVKPEVKPEPKPEPKAAPAPMPETTQPAKPAAVKEDSPKPAEQEEKKGWLDKLKFWGDEEKAQPKAAPTPAAKPIEPVKAAPAQIEQPKPEPAKIEPAKPEPAKVESKPPTPAPAEPPSAPRRPSLPDAKPKDPPQPAATLPPENAPDFFEKMLQKIGF
jgi:outer membrane protein assembly factor BamE